MMNTVTKLHHLYAWERGAAGNRARIVPSGVTGLDALLPDGGWPRDGVVEFIVPDMLAFGKKLHLVRYFVNKNRLPDKNQRQQSQPF